MDWEQPKKSGSRAGRSNVTEKGTWETASAAVGRHIEPATARRPASIDRPRFERPLPACFKTLPDSICSKNRKKMPSSFDRVGRHGKNARDGSSWIARGNNSLTTNALFHLRQNAPKTNTRISSAKSGKNNGLLLDGLEQARGTGPVSGRLTRGGTAPRATLRKCAGESAHGLLRKEGRCSLLVCR